MALSISPEKLAQFDKLLQKKGIVVPKTQGIPRRAAGQRVPLTSAQRRIWSLHQLAPTSPAYNMRIAFRSHTSVRADCLEEAINLVIARHEMLRTAFVVDADQPTQAVAKQLSLRLEQAIVANQDLAQQQAVRYVQQPFDLAQPPLLRAKLWEIGTGGSLVVIVTHQIMVDGASLSILYDEVQRCYQALLAQRQSQLTALPLQFGDYAVWQREEQRKNDATKTQTYWETHLGQTYTPPQLPQKLSTSTGDAGAMQSFEISAETRQQLHTLSNSAGTTLFTTLLTAIYTLLYGYSDQNDVLVFTSATNRVRPELKNLIGLLATQLPLRISIAEDETFNTLLGRVHQLVQSASLHTDLSFESLVEMIPVTDPAALFQVMFVLLPEMSDSQGDTQWEPIPIGNRTAKFDWRIVISESAGRMRCVWEYKRGLFSAELIEQITHDFTELLDRIVRQADVPLDALLTNEIKHWRGKSLSEVTRQQKAFTQPRNPLELQLLQIWSQLFAGKQIGIDDNFFALGGHSLLAVRFFSLLEEQFGYQLPLKSLVQAPTIAELAHLLQGGLLSETAWNTLVPVRPTGNKTPLFGIPPAGSTVALYGILAHHLPKDQPLYAFQPLGLEAGEKPQASVPVMASTYIAEMRTVQANGPYRLIGRCFGGLVAFEMARQLEAVGEQVELLAVLDTLQPPRRQNNNRNANQRANNKGIDRVRYNAIRFFNHSKRLLKSVIVYPRKSYLSAKQSFVWPNKHPKYVWRNLNSWLKYMQTLQAHKKAQRSFYVSNNYQGSVVFFENEYGESVQNEFLWQWEDLVGGEMHVHRLEGDHRQLTGQENLSRLSQALNQHL